MMSTAVMRCCLRTCVLAALWVDENGQPCIRVNACTACQA
jgi:hypothetical protein